jgi:hypothetical protein
MLYHYEDHMNWILHWTSLFTLQIFKEFNLFVNNVRSKCPRFKTIKYPHQFSSRVLWFNLFIVLNATQQYFSYIMVTCFSGGRSRSIQREPPTMGKQLENFITCGCESSAPFFVIYKAGCEPTPYWW